MTDIEPGRFVVVRTGGWLAWLIRRATKSPFNHAFIVTGPDAIIEARPEGVMHGSLSEYAGMPAAANTAEPMTQEQRIAVAAKAESLAGDGYGFIDLVNLGLESVGWHWRWLMRLCGADKHLICSAAVCTAGLAASPPMTSWECGKADPAEVKPSDLSQVPGVEPVTI